MKSIFEIKEMIDLFYANKHLFIKVRDADIKRKEWKDKKGKQYE